MILLLSAKATHLLLPINLLREAVPLIAKLCTRTLKDDAGNTYSYVDEEMRNRLQVRLITRTLAFHVG